MNELIFFDPIVLAEIVSITGEVLDTTARIVLAIQVGILLVYAIYMRKRNSADDTVTSQI